MLAAGGRDWASNTTRLIHALSAGATLAHRAGGGNKRIGALFDVERDINGVTVAERMRIRKEQSAPLKAQEAWLRSSVAACLARPRPPSRLAQVTPLGSFGCASGAERAAVMATLIMTVKLHDVDPQAWVADVLAHIAEHRLRRLEELLPRNWCAAIRNISQAA